MLKTYIVLFQQQLKLQVISYNNTDNIKKSGSITPHSQLLVSDPSLFLSCCRLQKLLNELYYPAHLPYVPFKLLNIKITGNSLIWDVQPSSMAKRETGTTRVLPTSPLTQVYSREGTKWWGGICPILFPCYTYGKQNLMFRNTYSICQQIIISQLEPKVLSYMVLQNHGR